MIRGFTAFPLYLKLPSAGGMRILERTIFEGPAILIADNWSTECIWVWEQKETEKEPNLPSNTRISHSVATLSSPHFSSLFIKLPHMHMNKENYRWTVTIQHWQLWLRPNHKQFSFPLTYFSSPTYIYQVWIALQLLQTQKREWEEKHTSCQGSECQ